MTMLVQDIINRLELLRKTVNHTAEVQIMSPNGDLIRIEEITIEQMGKIFAIKVNSEDWDDAVDSDPAH